MLKAVIFDMDGVLVDSEPLHYEADRILLEEKLNINLDYDYYKQYIGSTVTYMWNKIKKDFSIEEYEADKLRAMADEITERLVESQGYKEIEGVVCFVKSLKENYKIAVASSSYLEKIERNVRNLGLEKEFDKLVSGIEVANPKPAPDIFLEAAKRLGVEPHECVVVEDSENGVNAAKAAGMACIGFINKNSGDQNLAKADYLIESFVGIDGNFVNSVHAHCFDEEFIVFETAALKVREISKADVNDEAVRKLMSEALHLKEMRQHELVRYVEDYRNNTYKFTGFGLWLLELKKEKKIIGVAGVDKKENGNFELGYYILPYYRRQGYAYEACSDILKYVNEECGLNEVYASISKDNSASLKLAQKLGFKVSKEADNVVYMRTLLQ